MRTSRPTLGPLWCCGCICKQLRGSRVVLWGWALFLQTNSFVNHIYLSVHSFQKMINWSFRTDRSMAPRLITFYGANLTHVIVAHEQLEKRFSGKGAGNMYLLHVCHPAQNKTTPIRMHELADGKRRAPTQSLAGFSSGYWWGSCVRP